MYQLPIPEICCETTVCCNKKHKSSKPRLLLKRWLLKITFLPFTPLFKEAVKIDHRYQNRNITEIFDIY